MTAAGTSSGTHGHDFIYGTGQPLASQGNLQHSYIDFIVETKGDVAF